MMAVTKKRSSVRPTVFLIFLMLTMMLCHIYDVQYSTFIDYSLAANYVNNNSFNDSQIEWKNVEDGYIVYSPLCQIPNISAYHESIKKYISKWNPLSCSTVKPLTKIVFNATSRIHTLQLNKESAEDYAMNFKDISCCYSIISRKFMKKSLKSDDDDRYDLTKSKCFNKQISLPERTEFVYVTCSMKKHGKFVSDMYKNIHAMVVDKKSKYTKVKKTKTNNNNNNNNVEKKKDKKYSLFLFGIDSISRLNFIRTLPKTKRFIEENGWSQLEGYTKIADNTFPNLIAILTGMTVDQLRKRCWKSEKIKLDDCPFIWKNFSKESYLTAYVEDMASIASFNYQKYGFLNSPTDYYTRPLMVAGSKLLKIKTDGGMKYCMGQNPQIEYLFQYVEEFVQRLHEQPYFNLFWSNSFSHNELNMPTIMDVRIRTFLEEIHDYLNSTIVIFFSDHGLRFGKIRETYVGWLEERMPFIYFWLPSTFRKDYPQKYKNLLANRNRLTSPFDLYATIQDILYGRVLRTPEGCPMCDSLFKRVPLNRSCEDAAINSHWCTCSSSHESTSLSVNDTTIVSYVNNAIRLINGFLKKHSHQTSVDTYCATLTLAEIVSVRKRYQSVRSSLTKLEEYVIVFQTKPSGALFEATFQKDVEFQNIDAISRINMYGNQSSCLKTNGGLRLFCFCMKNTKSLL